jgi:hypothetical protein
MIPEILLSFTEKAQVVAWARVNGYDKGGIDALVNEWYSAVSVQTDTVEETDEY